MKSMTYRAGNLDTPDDCVEKRDMDILLPYRPAREKVARCGNGRLLCLLEGIARS